MRLNQQAAVEALNSLQSNAAVLEKARLLKDRQAVFNIPYVEKYLGRIGIPLEEVDNRLPVIHVSGTKVHAQQFCPGHVSVLFVTPCLMSAG